MKRLPLRVCALSHVFLSPSAWAQVSSTPAVENDGMGWLLVQTLIMLGGVVALAYLVLNVGLRKLLGLAKVPGGVPAVLKVLEKMPLEPKKSLVLVKAGEAYLLLGLSDQAVSLVARLEKDEVERMQSVSTAGPSQPSPFLTKLLSRRGQTPPPPTPPTE